jgi:hypothetical protein
MTQSVLSPAQTFPQKNRSAPSPKKSPENLKAKRVDAEIGFGSK